MTLYPPDGWTVAVGTWGADFDQSTTEQFRGAYALEFIDTATSGITIISDPEPVREAFSYVVSAAVRTDTIGGSDIVTLRANWYDSDDAFLSFGTAFSAALTDAGEWEMIGAVLVAPTDARTVRVSIKRDNGSYQLLVGQADIRKAAPRFEVYRSTSSQAITTGIGSPATVIFNTIDNGGAEFGVDGSAFYFDATTGEVTIREPGLWRINACVDLDALADGKRGDLYIYTDTGGGAAMAWPGTSFAAGASGRHLMTASCDIYLDRDDVVTAVVAHDHGSNRNVLVTTTRMSGALVG